MIIIDSVTFFNEFEKYKDKINLINIGLKVRSLSFSKIYSIDHDLDLRNLRGRKETICIQK
jgi:hypothetical protein